MMKKEPLENLYAEMEESSKLFVTIRKYADNSVNQ